MEDTAESEENAGEVIASPLKGSVIKLMDVKDEVFASEAMGKGLAIEPEEGLVYAPADGVITTFSRPVTQLASQQIRERNC